MNVWQRVLVTLAATAAVCASAAPTQYEKLVDYFNKGAAPTHTDLSGYWAGRCAESADPNTLSPAIFVHRIIEDATAVPPNRPSISYYTEKGDPALFDAMTPAQVEAYPAIKEFFSHEQWQAVSVVENSLVNYFKLSDKAQIQRAARSYTDEFNKLVVLKITRIEDKPEVYRYCYFHKYLGPVPSATPAGFPFGSTGPIANQHVLLHNPTHGALYQSLRIQNGDGDIVVTNSRMVLENGIPAIGPRRFRLKPGQAATIRMPDKRPFSVLSLEFDVNGATSNLEVTGNPVEASHPDDVVIDLN